MDVKQFQKAMENLKNELAEMWHKDGCWDKLYLIAESDYKLIFEAEKHSTQELYLIKTNTDGRVINIFKEARE